MLQSTKVRRRAYQDRETDERVSWSNDDLRKEAVKSCNAGCGDVDKGVASLPMSGHRRAPVDGVTLAKQGWCRCGDRSKAVARVAAKIEAQQERG